MFLTYFLVQELIGDDIFSIKKREYLGEVRMRKGENIAVFPCEIFHRRRRNDPSKIKETNNIDIDNNDIQNDKAILTTNSIGLHLTILICGQTDLFCAQ